MNNKNTDLIKQLTETLQAFLPESEKITIVLMVGNTFSIAQNIDHSQIATGAEIETNADIEP